MSCRYVKRILVPVVIAGFLIFPACRPSKTNKAVEPGTGSPHTVAKTTDAPAVAEAPAKPVRTDGDTGRVAPPVVMKQDAAPPAAVTKNQATEPVSKTATPIEAPLTDEPGASVAVADVDTGKAAAPSPRVISTDSRFTRVSDEQEERIKEKMSRRKLLTPSPQVRDRLDVAERAILKQWDKVRSLSATAATDHGQAGQGATSTSHGRYELLKTEKYSKIRLDMTTEREVKSAETTSIQEDDSQLLIDGEFAYYLFSVEGKLRGTKARPSPKYYYLFGGRALFMRLHEEYTVKLLADEMLDGHPVYVIASSADNVDGVAKHYFDKETGVLLKLFVTGSGGSTVTIEFSDIELNPTFPKDHFVWRKPVGVWIQDQTKDTSKTMNSVK